jgi:hypothetical protein
MLRLQKLLRLCFKNGTWVTVARPVGRLPPPPKKPRFVAYVEEEEDGTAAINDVVGGAGAGGAGPPAGGYEDVERGFGNVVVDAGSGAPIADAHVPPDGGDVGYADDAGAATLFATDTHTYGARDVAEAPPSAPLLSSEVAGVMSGGACARIDEVDIAAQQPHLEDTEKGQDTDASASAVDGGPCVAADSTGDATEEQKGPEAPGEEGAVGTARSVPWTLRRMQSAAKIAAKLSKR